MALALVAGLGVLVVGRDDRTQPDAASQDAKPTAREAKGVKFKRPEDARLRGIEAHPVTAAMWRPKVFVDGRVIPNPQATVEIRAPFAGVIRVESTESKLRLGASVEALDTLAMLDAHFTPAEGLDLRTKLVDAEGRHHSAEEVVKLRQERLARLEKLPAGLLPRDEYDAASVQLLEAQMQKNIALTQWKIWKQALETAGKKTVTVSLQTPMAGEVAELTAQPGANVDAGQVIARLVDFRRVLMRLDFAAPTSEKPADAVHVKSLDSARLWQAARRGRALSQEPALQKAAWLYEIMPDDRASSPCWQPGTYVSAVLDDEGKPAVAAIAIPAAALLVHQGRTLVYLERRLGRYERREVEVLGRREDAVIVHAGGWLSDDRVVTHGAQVLLSEEFRSEVDED